MIVFQPIVLVVDDVAWVRDVLLAGLAAHGFRVLLANSGRQAFEHCREEQGVDVALVDRRLQDGDGLELLAALRGLYPQLRCCLMSGEASHQGTEEMAELGPVRIFPKPFHLDEVAQALWQLLGEAWPPAV